MNTRPPPLTVSSMASARPSPVRSLTASCAADALTGAAPYGALLKPLPVAESKLMLEVAPPSAARIRASALPSAVTSPAASLAAPTGAASVHCGAA